MRLPALCALIALVMAGAIPSSAQRVSWFKRGFTSGRVDNCDTFAGEM